jgi:hypothetical protein
MNAMLGEISQKYPEHEKIMKLSMFRTPMCLEDVGIDGKITLKYIVQALGREGVDWTGLVLDRDKCWSFANIVACCQYIKCN